LISAHNPFTDENILPQEIQNEPMLSKELILKLESLNMQDDDVVSFGGESKQK
jgi:hypothetical protein